jgi:hypothetical protein
MMAAIGVQPLSDPGPASHLGELAERGRAGEPGAAAGTELVYDLRSF